MHYLALATDYDGTIAHDGVVDDATIATLERLRASTRKLILVTGRELPDLARTLPRMDLFDLIVAENGALLYDPASHEEHTLASPHRRASSSVCENWTWNRFRQAGSSSPRGSRTRPRC
jgi:HAD superfamily hydrolase (TIGR01484 family)